MWSHSQPRSLATRQRNWNSLEVSSSFFHSFGPQWVGGTAVHQTFRPAFIDLADPESLQLHCVQLLLKTFHHVVLGILGVTVNR